MSEEIDPEAEPWDLLATALGSLEELEDEEETLDFQESFSVTGVVDDAGSDKVPLQSASNLLKIRSIAKGILDGSLSREEYGATLKSRIQALENGLKAVDSPAGQKKLEDLPEEHEHLWDMFYNVVVDLHGGLEQMHAFLRSSDPNDVEEGLAKIEKGYIDIDKLHDPAIEYARIEAELERENAEG